VLALSLVPSAVVAQPRRAPPRRVPQRPPVRTAPDPLPPEPPPPPPALVSRPLEPPPEAPPPPPAPAPSREEPLRPNALDLAVSGRAFARELSYSGPVSPARPYVLDAAPSVRVDLAWHPAAHVTRGAATWFGLAGQYEMALGLQSTDSAGARYSTAAWSAMAGLRVRFPIEVPGLDLAALVGWRMQSFQVRNQRGAALSAVPDLDVQALQLGVTARIPLATPLALTLDAAYLHGFDLGAMGQRFPGSSTAGVLATAGLALRIVWKLELRAAFEMRLWAHTLGRPTGGVDAPRSAEDRYLGGTFGLAVRL
jgi:hypothetical protein